MTTHAAPLPRQRSNDLPHGRPPARASWARAAPWAVSLAFLASACAWYPKERGERLEQRVDRVEGEAPGKQLQADHAATEQRAQRAEAQIKELQKKVDELAAAPAPRAGSGDAAAAAAAREQLTGELTRQRTTLEALARRLDGLERTIAQLQAAPRERAPERRAARTPEPAARPTTMEHPVRSSEPPKDKAGVLAFAREQEASGQRDVARELYEQYVATYPDDPTAAEAHFRLGELAFGEKRYEAALGEYGKVAQGFPRSSQAPDALFRTAESMLRLDLKDDAATILSEIPKRYPESAAAGRARQRLAELKGSR